MTQETLTQEAQDAPPSLISILLGRTSPNLPEGKVTIHTSDRNSCKGYVEEAVVKRPGWRGDCDLNAARKAQREARKEIIADVLQNATCWLTYEELVDHCNEHPKREALGVPPFIIGNTRTITVEMELDLGIMFRKRPHQGRKRCPFEMAIGQRVGHEIPV